MRPTGFQLFMRIFMNTIPWIGLIAGARQVYNDDIRTWGFVVFYLGALIWGYARGRADLGK